MEPKEAVGEDSAVEERAELTLDEAWDAPLLDARVTEPGLQMMLDHRIQRGGLGLARDVLGYTSCLSRFTHDGIVVSGTRRCYKTKATVLPRYNGCISFTGWMPCETAGARSKMAPNGGALSRTPVHSSAQRKAT